MTTTRSYREAMAPAAAGAELVRCAGTQFDPAVVEALLAVLGVEPVAPRDGDLLAA
jgi:HD-GYP domain-containing protein (c-di-GMP phosphodiesterase class II)